METIKCWVCGGGGMWESVDETVACPRCLGKGFVSKKEWQRYVTEDAKLLEEYISRPYAMARVSLSFGSYCVEGVGFAKLRPGDKWRLSQAQNKSKGRAIGRALDYLWHKVSLSE